jgi:carbon-monoxide dehydrogenase large subunit
VGGAAVARASEAVIEKGKELAADLLEAAQADIAFADGVYRVVGTDKTLPLLDLPARTGAPLDAAAAWQPSIHTYPNGAHLCEVEIDQATGVPRIVRYTVVDDFGRVLNPLMLAGQVHGGIAQGAGQALLEEAVYDPASGQPVNASFMDYAMPRADLLPPIDFTAVEVPCRTNLLGMKGAGEAGCIGAPPAVINAVVDALAEFGVRHVDMPATPQKLWRLIPRAAAGAPEPEPRVAAA